MKISVKEARQQMIKELTIRVTPEDVGESFTSENSFDAFIKWLEDRAYEEAQRTNLSERVNNYVIYFGGRGSGRSYLMKKLKLPKPEPTIESYNLILREVLRDITRARIEV